MNPPDTLTTTTERLAAGQTPFLLEPENRPMSPGPWEVEPVHQNNNSGFRYWLGKRYAWSFAAITNSPEAEANAAFIVSLNGAEPIVEELWEDYCHYAALASASIYTGEYQQQLAGAALRKLRRLDGLRCLGWTPIKQS